MVTVTRIETTDLPDVPADAPLLALGEAMQGRLATATDRDVVAVDLVAGQTYSFAMVGTGTDRARDPFLRLVSSTGTVLAENDDGLQNLNARVTFTATETGRYYLQASEAKGRIGDYTLSATTGTKADFTLEMVAGVIDTGRSWSATRGTGATVTFDFRSSTTGSEPNFQPFTAGQQVATRAVLAQIAEVSGLKFTEANPTANSNDATILFGNYSASDGKGAYAGYPGNTASTSSSGDVWYNSSDPATTNTGVGRWFWSTMLHELGHAMGLSHPGDYAAGVGVSISYVNNATFVQDNDTYSQLTYFSANEVGGSDLNADTLMMADILALQTIYGANTTTRTGNTIYGFGSNAGEVYDFARNIDPKIAIWDAGGIDLIDVSRSAADQVVDLREGSLSNVLGYKLNLSIAKGAVIENATGGRGDDVLTGNAAANRLLGGIGDDTISGGAGNDTLEGGFGADLLLGGDGNDRLTGGRGTSADVAPAAFDLARTVYSEGDSLRASNLSLFPTGSFTLEFVLQQNGLTGQHYSLRFGNLNVYRYDNGNFGISFSSATSDSWLYGALPLAANDGQPHRLSITHDTTTGRLATYIDGSLFASYNLAPNSRGLEAVGRIALDDNASIGDIRLYDRALSADTIWAKAWVPLANPATETGLLHYWVGDGSGSLVNRMGGASLVGTGTTADRADFGSASQADTLEGGAGNDLYIIGTSADVVVELAGGGTDSLQTAVDFTLQAGSAVESLASTSTVGIRLSGNELGQTLISGSGIDTLAGGGGNDTYHVNSARDVLIELAGQGTDSLYASVSYTLGAGVAVERLYAKSTTGIALTGNELANQLTGGAGLDTLSGGAGNDNYYIGTDGDLVIETADGGIDAIYASGSYSLELAANVERLYASGTTGRVLGGNALDNLVIGSASADTISGGAGNDTLSGGAGDDVLMGGLGRDSMVGGLGADVFVFGSKTESAVGSLRDVIRDFLPGTDRIDLTGIDASALIDGDQSFAFTSGPAAHSVWAVATATYALVRADVTGDLVADWELLLSGVTRLTATDLLL